MFPIILFLSILSRNVLSSFSNFPTESRCEIKLICAVVNSKTVGGELSQLWESELMQGVMAYYEEGRNSTDPFSTEVYQAVTAGKNQGLWFVRGFQ